MTFFTQLAATGLKDASISIKVDGNGIMTVAMSTKTTANDASLKALRPMILTGTTSELDEGFFPTINEPVQKLQGVFNNVEVYNAEIQEAEKAVEASKKAKADATAKKNTDKKVKEKSEIAMELEAPAEEEKVTETVEAEKPKETTPVPPAPAPPTPPAQVVEDVIPTPPLPPTNTPAPPTPKAEMKVVKEAKAEKLSPIEQAEQELREFVEHPEYDPSQNKWIPITLYGALLKLDPTNEYGLSVKSAFRKWKLSYRP